MKRVWPRLAALVTNSFFIFAVAVVARLIFLYLSYRAAEFDYARFVG